MPKQCDYDRSQVSEVACLMCDEPIGNEPYAEVRILARFGQMLFVHKRCDDDNSDETEKR